MKRFVNILHVAVMALWPPVFLCMIGPIERHFLGRVSRTFDGRYILWLMLIYVICGCLLAAGSFGDNRRRDIFYAHIAAGFSVGVLFILVLLGYMPIDSRPLFTILPPFLSRLHFAHFGVFALVAGYTLCRSIRAVAAYKKQGR